MEAKTRTKIKMRLLTTLALSTYPFTQSTVVYASNITTTTAQPTIETTTADPFYRDLKSKEHLLMFWNGQGPYSGRSYNSWCQAITGKKSNFKTIKMHALRWWNDDPKFSNHLPGSDHSKDFYKEEFTKYDTNLDGLLDVGELVERQKDEDNLINKQLGFDEDYEAFGNTLLKTAEMDLDESGVGEVLLDYEDFAVYHIITDIIHGFALRDLGLF